MCLEEREAVGNEEPSWGRGSKVSLLLPSCQRYRPWLLVLRALRSLVYPSLWLECSPNAFSLSLGLGGGCSSGNLTRPVPRPRAIQDRSAFPLMWSVVVLCRGIPRAAQDAGYPLHPHRKEDVSSASPGQTPGSWEHLLIAMESSVRRHQPVALIGH